MSSHVKIISLIVLTTLLVMGIVAVGIYNSQTPITGKAFAVTKSVVAKAPAPSIPTETQCSDGEIQFTKAGRFICEDNSWRKV